MILENITGEVKVTVGNKAVAVGDTIEDSQYSNVSVIGKGKAVFRVDPNSTIERYGVKSETKEVASEVKAAPAPKVAKAAEPAPEAPAPIVEAAPTAE